jgi:hypothetical protein
MTLRGRHSLPCTVLWLRAQAAYDTEVAEEALADQLEHIKPWSGTAV